MTYSEPLLPVFLMLAFAGLVRGYRATGRKPVLLSMALAGLFLACWPPAEWLFSRPLESWYMGDVPPHSGGVQAIVVLSSNVEPVSKYDPVPVPDSSTLAGCRYAALLYRTRYAVPVIVSGGSTARSRAPFAAEMADLLVKEGVPQQHVYREESSRNTHENAAYSSELLRKMGLTRVALVVQADSMLRAEWCFRRQGIDVVAAPFGHRVLDPTVYDLLPCWAALRGNERTLHELGGLAWYKIRGWI